MAGRLTYIFTLSIGTIRPGLTVDPDQMPQNVASDQGLHYLPVVQQFLDTTGSEMELFKFYMIRMIRS